ncbi:hypothetical protein SK128_022221, partial [Halocaridina rubra]
TQKHPFTKDFDDSHCDSLLYDQTNRDLCDSGSGKEEYQSVVETHVYIDIDREKERTPISRIDK